MKNRNLIFASVILLSYNSFAAGYSTNTTSTSALATSYAGATTGSHDISNMYQNPATLSKFDKGEVIASLSYLNVDIDPQEANINGNQGHNVGDAGVDTFIPAFYLSTPINSKTNIGFLVNSPFGLATEYNSEWAGKNFVNDTAIETINLGTNISHKLNDQLSLGFGVNSQRMKYTSTFQHPSYNNAKAKFKGSDWGYGYNLGLNYDLNNKLGFGFGYKSKVKHEISGKYQIVNNLVIGDSVLKLTTPESANIGGKYKFTDKLNLMSDITWTRWSRHNTANLSKSDLPDFVYKWNDTFLYSLGGDYQYNDKLLVRFGGAFETGAATDAYREAAVPTGDTYWLSTGVKYDFNADLSVDATYLHQFYENVKINNTGATGNLQAKYRTQVNIISIALKKNF